MEGFNQQEKQSLVERKRQEAFATICDEIDARLNKDFDKTFEANGRSYDLTSAEDCMVAYAQQTRTEIETLYKEIRDKNDYREEQAVVKILELFKTYERLIALYAELRSYYPQAATRVEQHITPLTESAKQGEEFWKNVQAKG